MNLYTLNKKQKKIAQDILKILEGLSFSEIIEITGGVRDMAEKKCKLKVK